MWAVVYTIWSICSEIWVVFEACRFPLFIGCHVKVRTLHTCNLQWVTCSDESKSKSK